MTLSTLVRFFFFQRNAIKTIADCRGALPLGVLFVFGAALAREYDRSDLLAEPIHLFLPLLASLASSLLLWGLLWLICDAKRLTPAVPSYAEFLRCFWMTAPLAWLYAVPVERFLTEGNAVEANFWLLGIVATWRVVVITRVIQVLWSVPVWIAASIVLTYSDAVIIAANLLIPMPIFDIMSGNRLAPAESRLVGARILIGIGSFLSAPILLPMFVSALWTAWPPQERGVDQARKVNSPVWAMAILFLVLGGWLLTFGQPAQQRATQMTAHLAAGRFRDALDFQSRHALADFPPHWNPPPYPSYRNEEILPLARLVATIPQSETPSWVRDFWSRRLLRSFNAVYLADSVWQELAADELDAMIGVLEAFPADERKAILHPHWQPRFELGPHSESWPLQLRFASLFGMTAADLRARLAMHSEADSVPADALQPERTETAQP